MAAPRPPTLTFHSTSTYESGYFTQFTVYTFTVEHGGFEWTVRKRFNEVVDLLDDLRRYKRRSNPHFVIAYPESSFFGRFKPDFVRVRAAALLFTLQGIANDTDAWACPAVREFFEVSRLSFVRTLGRKGREGWIRKKSGGRKLASDGFTLVETWQKRWFVVKGALLPRLPACL